MRRVQKTLRAIGTADQHFAHSTPSNDPFFYSSARHDYLTGYALADLATILGRDPSEATHRLEAAAAGHTKDYVRTLHSRFAAEDVRELARYAATHQNLEEVAHLRQRIGILLVPTTDSP